MKYVKIPQKDLVIKSIYSDEQRTKQLQSFFNNMNIVSRPDNNIDYFTGDFRRFKYPAEFPCLCPEKNFEALTYYDQQTGNYGATVTFSIATQKEMEQMLRKINSMLSDLSINRPILVDPEEEEDEEYFTEEEIEELTDYNFPEVM